MTMTMICTFLKTPNCVLLIMRISLTLNTSTTLILNFKTCQKKFISANYLNFFLKTRAKFYGIEMFYSLPDCPPGRLINRKTTKSNSSTEKYARDCHTLYMFTQGEKSGLNEIFDKSKASNENS